MVELPLIHSRPGGQSTALPALAPAGPVAALYVHVPFCFHKCHYCDFYSITRQTPQRMEQFVERVLAEGDGWAGCERGVVVRPRTIFFGGGTPSLLPAAAMERLLVGLGERFDLSGVAEWTVEVNPATADADYCAMLRKHGVDRLSFGAQSFDRRELALLERHHDPEDVPRSIELARAAGFARLNLDLIFALPGQSMNSWMRSLEAAIALGTGHLSCYALTYEPNTPMAVRLRMQQFAAAPDALELDMLHATRDRLAAVGMPAYEISNFAAGGAAGGGDHLGQACLHNLNYWTGGDYIGLGPSAASHVAGTRWRNRPHLGEWERAIDEHQLPAIDVESLTPRQRAGELAMLMLRLERGLQFDVLNERTGCDGRSLFRSELDQLLANGLIEPAGDGVRLTRRGVAVADAVAAEFLIPAG